MGADDDVYTAVAQLLHNPLLLPLGAEAGEHLYLHRKRLQPFAEGVVMLFGQHGGGHQNRYLLAISHRFEGGPQRHLCLAVAHIATDEPVHGLRPFHIRFHLGNHAQLVFRLPVGEAGFQFRLPIGIFGEGVAVYQGAGGI